MGQYTKLFLEGVVKSFDGRIYSILLPDGELAVLKHSTVHKICKFPDAIISDDHLMEGKTIKLCKIIKDDCVSILPDHRYYYAANDDATYLVRQFTEVAQEAIFLLNAILKINKKNV